MGWSSHSAAGRQQGRAPPSPPHPCPQPRPCSLPPSSHTDPPLPMGTRAGQGAGLLDSAVGRPPPPAPVPPAPLCPARCLVCVHVCGAGGCSHAPCGDTAERGCVCQCLAARGERAVCHQGSSASACGCLRAQSCLCTHTREFVCAGTHGCGHLSSTRSCFVRTHTACTGTGKHACATLRSVCVCGVGGGTGTRWALGPPAPPVCPPGVPSLQP